MPIDYNDRKGTQSPRPVIFSGHLNDDERLLAIAARFQSQVDAHTKHPSLEPWLAKFEAGELDEDGDGS